MFNDTFFGINAVLGGRRPCQPCHQRRTLRVHFADSASSKGSTRSSQGTKVVAAEKVPDLGSHLALLQDCARLADLTFEVEVTADLWPMLVGVVMALTEQLECTLLPEQART